MTYRLYFMSEYSGHIDIWTEIQATDDIRAVAQARNLQAKRAIELWRGHERVAQIEALRAISFASKRSRTDLAICDQGGLESIFATEVRSVGSGPLGSRHGI